MNRKIIAFTAALVCLLSACGSTDKSAERAERSVGTQVNSEKSAFGDEQIKNMNSIAKTAYNSVMCYFADSEENGILPEQIFADGMLGGLNKPEGLKLGEDRQYSIYGEAQINTDLTAVGCGEVTVYVGRLTDRDVFVQVRDESGCIGQYPSPITAEDEKNVVWTEYLLSEEGKADEVNAAAKDAYMAMDMIRDNCELNGELDKLDSFFPKARAEGGFKIADGADAVGDKLLTEVLADLPDAEVYMGYFTDEGEEMPFIQVRGKYGLIGQYPDRIQANDSAEWTKFRPLDVQDAPEVGLDDLNEAARKAYNMAAEFITDNETQGIPLNECFESGLLGVLNTADGLPIAFGGSHENEFERMVNRDLAQYYDGALTVYVGRFGDEDFFVQVRDEKSGLIGQYPAKATEAQASEVKWTEFFDFEPEPANFDLKALNSIAKTAYNSAAEYIAEMECENGTDMITTVTGGGFPQAYSAEGLTVSRRASAEKGDAEISTAIIQNGVSDIVIVHVDINTAGELTVSAENPDGGVVGYYPVRSQSSQSGQDSAPLAALQKKISNLKTLNGKAKTAYNAVAEFLADKETEGTSIEECFESGIFGALNTADGLLIDPDAAYDKEGEKRVNEYMSSYDATLRVYVGYLGGYDFFVQVRDDESGLIGQYPSAETEWWKAADVKWTEFHESEPEK
ncbi:hypothetical protein [Ruminococcus sp.]|uniref:hypothetical protein n=1 Tax=Ruminococcus sp. TaxID=41978 RepID=UPI0025FFD0F5|nr:hypothetical protein [Ruminococcus sp.]MBQ9542165.1 hypothetical protein [Ruminococcus sp.]